MAFDPEKLQRERDALLKLHEINRLIATEPDLGKILEIIMDHAIALTRAERGFLILKAERGALDVRVARNIGRQVIDHPMFKVSKGIINEVLRTAQPVVLEDAREDTQFRNQGSVRNLALQSIACVPLRLPGGVIGVIYLDHRLRRGVFKTSDVVLMETFADAAAGCVATARLLEMVLKQREELKRLNGALQREVEKKTQKIDRLETRIRRRTPPP
jgi:GAF domain-containing protein